MNRQQFTDTWLSRMQPALKDKMRLLPYEESEWLSIRGTIAVMETKYGRSDSHE